jgi:ABC-2 type transport system permease protein
VIAINYARYDVIKTFRNRRFFIFAVGIPLILYIIFAGANRNVKIDGIPFPVYYLAGMASFGTMNASTSGGAVISLERAVGWTRQLRITPLPVWAYMASKVIRGYVMSGITIIVLYAAAVVSFNVHFTAGGWLLMTGLILVGLLPFMALGILLGHLVTPDTMGPALGGLTALFAIFGGAFGPLATTGWFHDFAQALPSYWLVQAGRAGLTHVSWPLEGWEVLAVWTLALGRLAMISYRRDTSKAS